MSYEEELSEDQPRMYVDCVATDRRPPSCNLEYFLMSRGLQHKYDALRSMGAKRICDLAHLTEDDYRDLSLSSDQVKLLTINVV